MGSNPVAVTYNEFGCTAVLQNISKISQRILTNECYARYCLFYQTKYNHKKINTQESKERKFEEKVREIGLVVWIFIYLYLPFGCNFLYNKTCTLKLIEMFLEHFSFAVSDCYDWWNDLKFSRIK